MVIKRRDLLYSINAERKKENTPPHTFSTLFGVGQTNGFLIVKAEDFATLIAKEAKEVRDNVLLHFGSPHRVANVCKELEGKYSGVSSTATLRELLHDSPYMVKISEGAIKAFLEKQLPSETETVKSGRNYYKSQVAMEMLVGTLVMQSTLKTETRYSHPDVPFNFSLEWAEPT
jgi:hypothetical protein